jgi:hypothetical protein
MKFEDLKRAMIDEANERTAEMRGMTSKQKGAYVRGVIENANLVYGVYQDAAAPDGVGMYIIKGRRELEASVASRKTVQLLTTAVACDCLERAVAAARVFGDGKQS